MGLLDISTFRMEQTAIKYYGGFMMMKIYDDDSLMLHTDLYQINMVESYWRDDIHQKRQFLSCFLEDFLLGAVTLFLPAWNELLIIYKISASQKRTLLI